MTSLPSIRFTTMSWLKTASPCGRPGADLRGRLQVPLGDLDRLGRVGDVEDVDVLELLEVVDQHDVPAAVAWLSHAKAECVWLALVCGLPLVCAPEAFGEVARALDELLGRSGLLTSTSEMPPTPLVVPGHHSFW